MSGNRIVVIGASAGGVEALKILASQLPEDFPAPVFIVLHVPPYGTSVLPQILSRAGALRAVHPKDGQAIEKGRIYVAPPDYHMLIKQSYMTLTRGPRENGHRPAVDPMFRSAARVYGNRVIGVVLSGVLDDGTAGLVAIKMRNGISVVQDPEDASYSGMPLNAIEQDHVDHIVPISEMAALLVQLANEKVPVMTDNPVPEEMNMETEIVELQMEALEAKDRPGTPSVYACPECGGILWEIEEGELIRFRCRVGHAFSAHTLLAEQSEALEEAFWAALRALEESAVLARRLAERSHAREQSYAAAQFEQQARDAELRAKVVRDALLSGVGHLHNTDKKKTDEK